MTNENRDRDSTDAGNSELDSELQRAMAEAEEAVERAHAEEASRSDEIDVEDDVDVLRARVDAAEAEIELLRDKWVRAVADLDNFKKRVRKEIDEERQRAISDLLTGFLPVADNLERALAVAGSGTDVQSILTGVRMVRDEFTAALAKQGIEPIASVGRPFDPAVHDALQQEDSPDFAPGTVIREFERGWIRQGRLIRPARVVIAGPNSTGGPNAGGE